MKKNLLNARIFLGSQLATGLLSGNDPCIIQRYNFKIVLCDHFFLNHAAGIDMILNECNKLQNISFNIQIIHNSVAHIFIWFEKRNSRVFCFKKVRAIIKRWNKSSIKKNIIKQSWFLQLWLKNYSCNTIIVIKLIVIRYTLLVCTFSCRYYSMR